MMRDPDTFWVNNPAIQPSSIDELALYPSLRKRLKKYVSTNRFPPLIFYGPPGTGKTTAAIILGKSMGDMAVDMLDFGEDNSIELIRYFISLTKIRSLFGRRVIILDEFHDVNESKQRRIKKTIEDRNSYNKFIFCVNDIRDMDVTIFDRCSDLQFDFVALDIMNEPYVLPHTGWSNIDEWKDELIRVSGIMAKKSGKTITDEQYDRVFSRGERYKSVRSFIISLEEAITDDEYDETSTDT